MNVFLKNVILRPSCYSCQARCGQSMSDITMADFWGINGIVPKMDDDKGTSLIFLNTEKGEAMLKLDKCRVSETSYEAVIPKNPACIHSPGINPMRTYFFQHLGSTPLLKLMKRCSKPTREERYRKLKSNIKTLINKALQTVHRGRGGGESGINCHIRIVVLLFRNALLLPL